MNAIVTPLEAPNPKLSFEAGLKLFAYLLLDAREHKDDGQLCATFRGRSVEQALFADEFLKRAHEDADVRAGFVSALSGFLAAWAIGEHVSPEDFRQATWEQVHGDPDTIYFGEVDPTRAPRGPIENTGGAAATAPETEPAEHAAGQRAPAAVPSWRPIVADLVEKVEGLIGAAARLDLDSSTNGSFARGLLYGAQQILDWHAHVLRRGEPSNYCGECIHTVQSVVTGARFMPETAPGMGVVLGVACDMLGRAATILDNASVGPIAPPLFEPAPDQNVIDAFMLGKSLCADMVSEAIGIDAAGSDEADIHARFRARGMPQNNFALWFVTKVMERPELLEGFSAALSSTLRTAGSANDSPTVVRDLTYDGYMGGPDTKYSEDEDDDLPADTEAKQDPVFTDPIEIGMDAILGRIDGYRDGLQHQNIGAAEYECFSAETHPHYWSAREALNGHASPGTVMRHMRQLRDGLNKLVAVMEESNVGLPLVQACLKPLNVLFRRTAEDVEFTPDRIGTATSAGTFISRMVGLLRADNGEVKPQDWMALDQAAGVVISIGDPMEDDQSLRERLGTAIDTASVIFEAQPPRHFRQGGAVRQEDVGKRFVVSLELQAA